MFGKCHICGAEGNLTFEHVPPRAAFNDRRAIAYGIFDVLNTGPDQPVRAQGKILQRGVGGYTLCAKCNNNTGAWYSKAFAEWCYQGAEFLAKAGSRLSLYLPFWVFPLRVLKQIVVMFFSVNGPDFAAKNPELVRFVLNRETKYLNPRYRFFIYLNREGRWLRQAGYTGRLCLAPKRADFFCEINFPPFGYVLTIEYPPPDERLCDISFFARFGYNEFRDVFLRLPVLPTYSWLPGDYRTKEEIIREREQTL